MNVPYSISTWNQQSELKFPEAKQKPSWKTINTLAYADEKSIIFIANRTSGNLENSVVNAITLIGLQRWPDEIHRIHSI